MTKYFCKSIQMATKDLLITDRDEIRKSWGKTKDDVYKDINIIKVWLTTQPHLPEIPNDNMIEFFLTNCKYSIEKTKQNLDMYYTIRDLLPNIYRTVHPCSPLGEKAFESVDFVLLPKLTPSLHRVCIVKYRNVDRNKFDIVAANANFISNTYEIRIQEDLAMGDIYVLDFEFMQFSAISQMTPILLKQYVLIGEKVQSSRLHGLHYLNPPGFVEKSTAIFKSFLNKKLQDRIQIHKTLDDLFKHVPKDILPSDYGGNEKSIAELRELWRQKMAEYKDRFDKLETMKVNEQLRPEKLQNDDILGYHGNFKKIEVD